MLGGDVAVMDVRKVLRKMICENTLAQCAPRELVLLKVPEETSEEYEALHLDGLYAEIKAKAVQSLPVLFAQERRDIIAKRDILLLSPPTSQGRSRGRGNNVRQRSSRSTNATASNNNNNNAGRGGRRGPGGSSGGSGTSGRGGGSNRGGGRTTKSESGARGQNASTTSSSGTKHNDARRRGHGDRERAYNSDRGDRGRSANRRGRSSSTPPQRGHRNSSSTPRAVARLRDNRQRHGPVSPIRQSKGSGAQQGLMRRVYVSATPTSKGMLALRSR